MNTPAFITGSTLYGIPNEKSDIDLVCLVEEDTMQLLLSELGCESVEGSGDNICNASIVIGEKKRPLNLILTTDFNIYQLWREGTDTLHTRAMKRRKPISREEAIKHFNKLRDKLSKEE